MKARINWRILSLKNWYTGILVTGSVKNSFYCPDEELEIFFN